MKFTEILSSDLGRARETTKLITEYHNEVPISFDSALRERCAGVYEGKDLSEYRAGVFVRIMKKLRKVASKSEISNLKEVRVGQKYSKDPPR